jgi:hypothetical protein
MRVWYILRTELSPRKYAVQIARERKPVRVAAHAVAVR